MTRLPKNLKILAVIDAQIFVPAIAASPKEADFYRDAIRKCWKFVFSLHIREEYQRVIQKYGFRGDVVIHELNKLDAMNKYRTHESDCDDVSEELAPRKDKHIVAPCLHGPANVIVSNDRGLIQRREKIRKVTGAILLTIDEAEEALNELPDCRG